MKKMNALMSIFAFISILFITVSYAAFNTSLYVSGRGVFRAHAEVRVVGIRNTGYYGEAIENFNPNYNVDETNMSVDLPTSGSYMTYEVTIKNYGNEVFLPQIEVLSGVSSNVNIAITDGTTSYNLPNNDINYKLNTNEEKTYTITISNKPGTTNEDIIVSLKYHFVIDEVTTPVIAQSSNEDSIELVTPGTSTFAVDYYEYYISESSTDPAANATATGTTDDDLDITNENYGHYFVWYRTVSTKGTKSEWSNKVEVFKKMTVTANANGGTIPTTSGWTNGSGNTTATKTVHYGSAYGALPQPTKSGYAFEGWNGKNLINVDAMLSDNLTYNSSDDSYTITKTATQARYSKPFYFDIPAGTTLTFSWDVLDYNGTYANPFQMFIIHEDGTERYIINEGTITLNKRAIRITIYQEGTMPNGTYTKFKNLQMEIGSTATTYEPYYVTSSTIVTRDNNHTLTAIWRDNVAPTLTLAKETYVTTDFNSWNKSSGTTLSSGVMTFNSTSDNATMYYVNVNGGKWWPIFDGYVENTASAAYPKGSINWGSSYYDAHYKPANSLENVTVNGWAVYLPLNQWNNELNWYSGKSFETNPRYGPNVKYVTLYYSANSSSYNSAPPIKIRNVKVYGEAIPNTFYDIKITSNDNVGVVTTKYASGTQTASYFTSNGTAVTGDSIRVTANGTYTVYVADAAGNSTVQTITIDNIISSQTLYLDANGGTIPTTSGYTLSTNGYSLNSASKSVTYASTYGALPTPTRSGYSFAGWSNIYNYGNITLTAGSSDTHKYFNLYNDAMPGVTYNITMSSAVISTGSATQFRTLCYDFSGGGNLASVDTSFGSNVSYSITCPATADKTHKLSLIIYAGIYGSPGTSGNVVTYSNIKINTTDTPQEIGYTSSITIVTPRTHELFAKWSLSSVTCSAGTYLAANANSCTTCPKGNYCPGGSFGLSNVDQGLNPCGDGKYNASTGQSAVSACLDIDAGCYGSSGTTSCPAECAQNTYSTGGAATCTACPTNYTTTGTKSTAKSACKITCSANTRVTAADGGCTGSCSTGYSIAQHTVDAGSTSAACGANSYTLKRLAGNKFDSNSLTVQGAATLTKNSNAVYTLTNAGNGRGAKISSSLFTAGKRYILTFKVKKTSGTLYRICGHSNQTQHRFLIDGSASSLPYMTNSTESNITNDTNVHTIWYEFTYTGTGSDNNVYIQPNRSSSTSVDITITDLMLMEELTTNTKSYGVAYTSTELASQSRSGYTFNGWYNNPNFGTKLTTSLNFNTSNASFDNVSTASSQAGIYAKYTAASYTITFNKQSGTGGTDSVSITYGTLKGSYPSITLPTRSGYSFGGYYTSTNGGGTQYYNSSGSSVIAWELAANTILYAKWTACGPGTYLNGNTCTSCPAGKYSSGTANASCSNCTAGYYCNSGSTSATQNDCPAGKYCPAGTGNTTIKTCPTADSGWTATSPTKSTAYSACYEYQTPANCASGSVKRVATSATAYGTDITLRSTLKANAKYYTTTTATSCTACSTLASGSYTTSAANTNSGNTACYIPKANLSKKYVATKKAEPVDCTAGYYCPGTTDIYYDSTGGRTACPTGYNSAAKSSAETACKITCSAGTRVTTARGQCTGSCDTGYEIAEHTVNVPNTSAACTIKKYTITFSCNGGTGTAPSSQTINHGSNVDLTVRCTGYKIATGTSGSVKYQTGWSTTTTGSALTSYSPTSSITLHAVYTNLLTYSGSYNVLNDGSGNWRVKLLSSGTLSVAKSTAMDLFAVGGGGGGSKQVGSDCQEVSGSPGLYVCTEGGSSCSSRRAGGGGGYTTTVTNKSLNGNYTVTIGAGGTVGNDGNATSLGTLITAAGGKKAASYSTGGAGGSGGAGCSGSSGSQSAKGGSNGSSGEDGQTSGHGGAGQGTTTKEFGTGDLYAGGGGANPGQWAGGSGGGGAGCSDGVANTGGGGGGSSGAGGSGIVVIRNKR